MKVEHEMVRLMVVWVMGRSPKVMAGSDGGEVVGQEYLPIPLALGKRGPVVIQMRVIVDCAVFDSQPGGCRDCWLTI